MSKSHRKSYRSTICMVSLKSMRQWKNDSTQIRRSRENTELKKIDPQDPEETQRNCNIKYQKSKKISDWSGPHDGYWFYPDAKKYNTYHCHLSYHWVACWIETQKRIELEVTYVGSRENAPY